MRSKWVPQVLMRFSYILGFDQMDNIGIYLRTGKLARFDVVVISDKSPEAVFITFDRPPTIPLQQQHLLQRRQRGINRSIVSIEKLRNRGTEESRNWRTEESRNPCRPTAGNQSNNRTIESIDQSKNRRTEESMAKPIELSYPPAAGNQSNNRINRKIDQDRKSVV